MDKQSAFNKLREEERSVRKQIIIDSALYLLSKKTFDEIGMRDIAAEAGISPASLYRYFPSQTNLLLESFLHDLEKITMDFNKKFSSGKIDTIDKFAMDFIAILIEKEALFQMMSYIMIKADIDEEFISRLNIIMKKFFSKIQNLFKSSGIEIENRKVIHAFFASLTGIIMTFRNFPSEDKEGVKKHIEHLSIIISDAFKNTNNQ